jgi:hypothetical protein
MDNGANYTIAARCNRCAIMFMDNEQLRTLPRYCGTLPARSSELVPSLHDVGVKDVGLRDLSGDRT